MHKILLYIEQKPWHIVAFLFLFHILLATLLDWIANSSYLSSLHNGQGFWKFSIDATKYHKEALDLLVNIEDGKWNEWLEAYPDHKHVKLISLVYWLFGSHPLSFEIVNAATWVLTVVLIYLISYHVFNKNTIVSIISSLYMFFPSILISSTQLTRDQFYILGLCLIIYGFVVIYIRNYLWKWVLPIMIGYILILWMRPYIIPIFLLVFIPWIIINLWKRNISIFPVIFIVGFCSIVTINDSNILKSLYTPPSVQSNYLEDYKTQNTSVPTLNQDTDKSKEDTDKSKEDTDKSKEYVRHWMLRWLDANIATKIENMRSGFLSGGYDSAMESGVDIDTKYFLIEDVLLHFPRAAQVGFLSPFYSDWISVGQQTGRIGRAVSGMETMVMYFIFIGFLWVIFFERRKIHSLVPMLLFSGFVVILLGYVVPNLGAIYRMRQGLFIPFYIVGSYGLFMFLCYYKNKK